jgi:hypothetical protein
MSQRDERSMQPDMDGLAHWLIHHAAGRAPDALSSRLEEEWLADLEARSSALSRLRFAVGCCWATVVIVSEYPRARVAAASSAAAGKGLVTLVDRNFGYFSLRSGTLFLIAGLHAALFYGLITTLGHTRAAPTITDLQNHVVPDVPHEKLPLIMPSPDLPSWTIHVPQPPNIDVRPDPDRPTDVTTKTAEIPELTSPRLETPPQAPPHVARQVPGGPGAGFPDTADFYPSLSRHLEEQGISVVRVCVDTRGRLTADPTTVTSSGSMRLDDGARKLARAGSGHYRAATEDGQPVSSCYPLGIRFQLRN